MDIQNISIGADPNLLIEEGIYNIVNDATVHANHPSITEGGLLIVKNGSNSKLTQTFIGSWGIYTRAGTFSTAWNTGDWVLNGAEESAVHSTASDLAYINTTSNLEAEDVQEAIDEIVASMFAPVVDTWHACTPNPLLPDGSTVSIDYRKNKIGQLEIKGSFVIDNTVSPTNYFTLTKLPEGYRPPFYFGFVPAYDEMMTVPNNSATVIIRSDGDINFSVAFDDIADYHGYTTFFVTLPLE